MPQHTPTWQRSNTAQFAGGDKAVHNARIFNRDRYLVARLALPMKTTSMAKKLYEDEPVTNSLVGKDLTLELLQRSLTFWRLREPLIRKLEGGYTQRRPPFVPVD